MCLAAAPAGATGGAQGAAARSGAAILPERMKSTRDAVQLIIVTGPDLGSRSGSLRLYDHSSGHSVQRFKAPATFGRNGLTEGVTRREGDGPTPTGIWRMSQFAFGGHTATTKGCTLAWRRIKSTSWWSSA